MIRQHRQPAPVALVVMAAALLGTCAVLWILGTVPSGGPDEPSHIVRGAALVRGDLEGQPYDGIGAVFEVPAWVGHPNPGCFSLVGEQPANCATAVERPLGEKFLVSTAPDYPVWGHVAPGLATYFPASVGGVLARVFDAAIPVGLLIAGLALAARRGRLALGAAALAITPMAWFSVIVVNPSGLAIAGGFALWAGLLSADRLMDGHPDRLVAWTIVAGWAAASLPRRDGAIWAALIVAICAAVGIVDLRKLLTRLGLGPIVLLVASILAAMAWALTSDEASTKAIALAPLIPIVGVLVRAGWSRTSTRRARTAIAGVLAGAVLVVGVGTVLTRRGGYDGALTQRVLGETGRNIEEAIGLLGWLDIPLPPMALFAWFLAVGILVGVALLRNHGDAVGVAVGVIGVAILASWILELSRGSATGTYFQGRYYLPLLIGIPMLLTWPTGRPNHAAQIEPDPADDRQDRMIGSIALATGLTVLTAAFGASMRRWGVGTLGSNLPWTWDTYGAFVPPWLLLLAHVGVCIALYVLATRFVSPAQAPRMSVQAPAMGVEA